MRIAILSSKYVQDKTYALENCLEKLILEKELPVTRFLMTSALFKQSKAFTSEADIIKGLKLTEVKTFSESPKIYKRNAEFYANKNVLKDADGVIIFHLIGDHNFAKSVRYAAKTGIPSMLFTYNSRLNKFELNPNYDCQDL